MRTRFSVSTSCSLPTLILAVSLHVGFLATAGAQEPDAPAAAPPAAEAAPPAAPEPEPEPDPRSIPPGPLEEGFTPLFNGTDLTGWVPADGNPMVFQDGVIAGNPRGPGSLRTEAEFADFDLRLEYWTDRGATHEANGGIFFRISDPVNPARGYEAQISTEDASNPTGSIWGRVPQNIHLVNSVAPEKQWNSVRILAVGPRIRLWYNGQPLQDCTLHDFAKGYIAVQHHHNGCTMLYRNIRIRELGPGDAEPGWESLFNGEDLTGWTQQGQGEFKAHNREIEVTGGPGVLYHTAREIGDFELRAMVFAGPRSNSGILFRSRWPEADPAGLAEGFECQIDNWDEANTTGIKNVTGGIFGRGYAPLLTRDEAWFSLRIRAVGDHLQTWVNGRLATDIRDGSFASGFIALQGHDEATAVRFRDILVRPASD